MQRKKFSREGLCYHSKGQSYQENEFDFSAFLALFKKYVDVPFQHHEKENRWFKEIGPAQFLLPLHVARHYCAKKNLEHDCHFYNDDRNRFQFWFQKDELFLSSGRREGIIRGNESQASFYRDTTFNCEPFQKIIETDYQNLCFLYITIKNDLIAFDRYLVTALGKAINFQIKVPDSYSEVGQEIQTKIQDIQVIILV